MRRATALPAHAAPAMRTNATRTSRASAAFSPARPASTISARSSPCRIPAARRTFTSRSSAKGKELTTQCYIKGHAQNERDGVFRGIRDEKARDSVEVDFAPLKESKLGELAAKFDIVLGMTPEG